MRPIDFVAHYPTDFVLGCKIIGENILSRRKSALEESLKIASMGIFGTSLGILGDAVLGIALSHMSPAQNLTSGIAAFPLAVGIISGLTAYPASEGRRERRYWR